MVFISNTRVLRTRVRRNGRVVRVFNLRALRVPSRHAVHRYSNRHVHFQFNTRRHRFLIRTRQFDGRFTTDRRCHFINQHRQAVPGTTFRHGVVLSQTNKGEHKVLMKVSSFVGVIYVTSRATRTNRTAVSAPRRNLLQRLVQRQRYITRVHGTFRHASKSHRPTRHVSHRRWR